MKKILKNNSKLLIIITFLESLLSIYFLIYMSYVDRLTYIKNSSNLTLLIQSIFSITSIIYKKNYLHFISILIWITLFILALDFTKGIKYNISNICIFIPIILLNIKAYFNQKNK